MITILIDFFSKQTEELVHEIKLDVPNELVFAAAESTNINYINAHAFSVTEAIKEYVIEHHPYTAENFDLHLCEFIGRHGLGPEYD